MNPTNPGGLLETSLMRACVALVERTGVRCHTKTRSATVMTSAIARTFRTVVPITTRSVDRVGQRSSPNLQRRTATGWATGHLRARTGSHIRLHPKNWKYSVSYFDNIMHAIYLLVTAGLWPSYNRVRVISLFPRTVLFFSVLYSSSVRAVAAPYTYTTVFQLSAFCGPDHCVIPTGYCCYLSARFLAFHFSSSRCSLLTDFIFNARYCLHYVSEVSKFSLSRSNISIGACLLF